MGTSKLSAPIMGTPIISTLIMSTLIIGACIISTPNIRVPIMHAAFIMGVKRVPIMGTQKIKI